MTLALPPCESFLKMENKTSLTQMLHQDAHNAESTQGSWFK